MKNNFYSYSSRIMSRMDFILFDYLTSQKFISRVILDSIPSNLNRSRYAYSILNSIQRELQIQKGFFL